MSVYRLPWWERHFPRVTRWRYRHQSWEGFVDPHTNREVLVLASAALGLAVLVIITRWYFTG